MDMQIPFLFSFHVFLLGIKVWFIWVLMDMLSITESTDKKLKMLIFKNSNMVLLVFSIVIIFAEMWFIYSFYRKVNLFPYDYISILDQIFLTLMLALSYKGGKI